MINIPGMFTTILDMELTRNFVVSFKQQIDKVAQGKLTSEQNTEHCAKAPKTDNNNIK